MAAPHERVAGRAAVGRWRETPASFYQGSSNAPAGSASMTRYGVVYRLADEPRDPGGVNQLTLAGNGGGVSGWRLFMTPSNGNFRPQIVDSGLNFVNTATVAGPPARRVGLIGFSYDGSTLRSRTDAGQTNSVAAPAGGYTNGADNTTLGVRPASLDRPAPDYTLLALLGSDSEVRSDAEMQTDLATLVDNLEQDRDLRTGLGHTPDHYWDARDVVIGGGGLRSTWTDRIGGIDLTKNGSPEGLYVPARFA